MANANEKTLKHKQSFAGFFFLIFFFDHMFLLASLAARSLARSLLFTVSFDPLRMGECQPAREQKS